MNEIEKFVDDTYLKILRRHADDEGLRLYVEHISEGRLKREDLEGILKVSEEYKEKFSKEGFGDRIDWDEEANRILREDTDKLFYPRHVHIDNVLKNYKSGGKVLDCGCHIGRFVEAFKNAGYDYVGIDQSEYAIEIAKRYHPNEMFLTMFLWDMDFNEEFDVAFTNAVLQHNTNEEKKVILPRIYRSLKPDGVLFIRESTVLNNTNTQYSYYGWLDLMQQFGFYLLESWHENELGLYDNYIFAKNRDDTQRNLYGAKYDFELGAHFGINLPKIQDITQPAPPSDIAITIAIPNYNRAHFFDTIFKSVFAQTFPREHYEILVVDDASDDESIPVLRELCDKYKEYNIRVFPLDYTRTYCPGHPWNVAVRNARGWIFVLFQADLVMVDKNVLESSWRYHNAYDKLFLSPFCTGLDEGGESKVDALIDEGKLEDIRQYCGIFKAQDEETLQRFGAPFPNPNGMSIRTKYLANVHGFDEMIRTEPTEVDLFSRLTRAGIIYGMDHDAVITNRRYAVSRANSLPTKPKFVWNPDIIVRNGDNWGLLTEGEKKNVFGTK